MAMQSSSKGPICDINVTPLVDVCLVLVIIFMVIAPFALQAGIEVASSRKGAAKGKAAVSKNVVVRVDGKGRLKVNGRDVAWGALEETLRQAVAASQDKLVSIDADPGIDVGRVVDVLDASKQGGAQRLALLNR